MMEPAVGASTCASGSQVCRGKIGTLIANATKNARKSSICSPEVNERSPRESISRILDNGLIGSPEIPSCRCEKEIGGANLRISPGHFGRCLLDAHRGRADFSCVLEEGLPRAGRSIDLELPKKSQRHRHHVSSLPSVSS